MANGIIEGVVSEVQKGAKKERRKGGAKNKSISRDKENICVFDEILYSNSNIIRKSPLPADYPRIPLQDITAVLSPANVMKLEEGESSQNSHFTRSKTRKSAISFPVLYELNVVKSTKVSEQDVVSEKREAVPQDEDLKDNSATTEKNSTILESEVLALPNASEAEDCLLVQKQPKRRRPQPRASAGAERSTSMLKFR